MRVSRIASSREVRAGCMTVINCSRACLRVVACPSARLRSSSSRNPSWKAVCSIARIQLSTANDASTRDWRPVAVRSAIWSVSSCSWSDRCRNAPSTCTIPSRSSAMSAGRSRRSVPSIHSPGCSSAGVSSSRSLVARYSAYASCASRSSRGFSAFPASRTASSSLRAFATATAARTRSTSSISSSRDSRAPRLRSAAMSVPMSREPTSSRAAESSELNEPSASRCSVGRAPSYVVGRRKSPAVSFGDGSRYTMARLVCSVAGMFRTALSARSIGMLSSSPPSTTRNGSVEATVRCALNTMRMSGASTPVVSSRRRSHPGDAASGLDPE